MEPLFARYGVTLIALSRDTPAEARAQRQRDHLTFPLLCDPDLHVITRYGLLHQSGLRFFTFHILGVPIGWPTGFQRLALPTTLLIDEAGLVRWIDQTDDYRLRGTVQRLETALQATFGAPSA
jgi:peroxiredoxin